MVILKGETGEYLNTGSDILLGGINLSYAINNKNTLELSSSAIKNEVTTNSDTFNIKTDATAPIWKEQSSENKYSVSVDFRL
ncbi:MAG: hypothetical protein ACK5MG_05615 [Bacteroidales bacterium]